MGSLDTTYKQKPLWLDNAHLQPCGDQFEFGKYYRCYWYDESRPSYYRPSTICQCVPGFQQELCFITKNRNDFNRYMPCAFHKIEDLEGNVLLYPPPIASRCDRCQRVVYTDFIVAKRLKADASVIHFLCRECGEDFKKLYEEKVVKDFSKR